MKAKILFLLVLALILVIFLPRVKLPGQNRGGDTPGVVCTLEAKLCPDGSYVSRVGPKCEFAPCLTPTSTEGTLEMGLNKSAFALDVRITALAVLEDSRCPLDVTCIQAGTVRVKTTLESGVGQTMHVFTLNMPITTEAEIVELTKVTPDKYSGKQIQPADYYFVFKVIKRPRAGV